MGVGNRALSVVMSGVVGIAAQIILLRELLVSFQGNELSLGIILANWLLLEALGCILAGRSCVRPKNPRAAFALVQSGIALSLPLGILLARSARVIMGLPLGAGLGIDAMFYVSLIALMPVTILHGVSFVWAGLVLGEKSNKPGGAYVYETLGTMAGGVVITFALIPRLTAYDLALVVMMWTLLSTTVLFWFDIQGVSGKRKVLLYGCVCLSILAMFPLAVGYRALHAFSLRVQWAEQALVGYKNTIYGNIAVVERAGEYTFFIDGKPVITTPFPDVVRLEEFVHFTMLSHPRPEAVAVITGGAGGKIKEILRHPSVVSIDYVELDPELLAVITAFPTALTEFEMTHPSVSLHFADGRYFLQRTGSFFDAVLIGITNPNDLQNNRFFTREFFVLVKQRLNLGGVVALSLPSLPRADLIVAGLAELNRTVYATMRDVFPYVRVYPGDSVNLFVASTRDYVLHMNASSMYDKIVSRGMEMMLLSEPYIAYRTLPWWQDNFYTSLGPARQAQLNRDFAPRAVFASMMHFSAMFTPPIARALDFIKAHGTTLLLAILGLAMAVGVFFGKRADVPVAILTTGFAGMLLDLVLIFAFQAIFGVLFFWIGILVSLFMAGAAFAAYLVSRPNPGLKNPAKVLVATEVGMAFFAVVLPLLLIFLRDHTHVLIPADLSKAIFVLLSFGCGVLVGAEFPVACQIMIGRENRPLSAESTLYALDLLGGWAGGVVGGIFLLPLLGLVNACVLVAGVKSCSALMLAFSRWKNA